MSRIPLSIVLIFVTSPLLAQSVRVEPDFNPPAIEESKGPQLIRIFSADDIPVGVHLNPARVGAKDKLERMYAHNDARIQPPQIGIVRSLPEVMEFRGALPRAMKQGESAGFAVQDDEGQLSVATSIVVDGSHGVKLRLSGKYPEGTNMWVWGPGTPPLHFEARGQKFWTPLVWGDQISLQINLPSPRQSEFIVSVDSIADIQVGPAPDAKAEGTECLQDASCFSTSTLDIVDAYRRAVAWLVVFNSDEAVGACTGALVNDSDDTSTIPYLLTADHCLEGGFDGIEAFWDFRTPGCGGSVPTLSSLSRSSVNAVLARGAASDFALLRLASIPANRALLGWDPRTTAVPSGTTLHRISHPFPDTGIRPQSYSQSRVTTTSATCSGLSRPSYLYSQRIIGSTTGGSSGAPVILSGGYIVGQLYGACGSNTSDPCDFTNSSVDGSFAASYPALAPFLRPSTTTCSPCVSSATTACLLGNRFKVTLPSWYDPFAKISGQGTVLRYAENREEVHPQYGPLGATSFFSFYAHALNSIEVTLRMFKGAAINDHYWVFMSGFTGADYTIRVEDTQTCKVWQRSVPSGATNVVKDYEAFPFP